MTGTGLGLYGVRTRAEGLLGSCGARHNTESSTGTGTVLWFAIPYTPDNSGKSFELTVTAGYQRTLDLSTPPSDRVLNSTSPRGLSLIHPDSGASARAADNLDVDPAVTAVRARKLTAIVVDDTKTVCKLMERLLLNMGFESVKCYSNGAKGLDALMTETVDIVFSDVQMPIMTGPEVS